MSNQREVLSRNLRRLINSKGVDQKILADFLGISEMSVSNWVNGVKYPRIGNIQKMAEYFGGKKSDLIEDNEDKPTYTTSRYNYYPASISAAKPIVAEAITEYDTKEISIPDNMMGKWRGNKDIYITKINGESMNLVIPDQSIIAIKPVELQELKDGDIVVYCYDGEYAVKRFYRYDNKIIFRPDSSDIRFTDLEIDLNDENLDLKIKGKVVLYIVELD